MNARQHESLLTGKEIADVFGDRTVFVLEEQHEQKLSRMSELSEALKSTDDIDEQERLQDELGRLREEDRQILQSMREAQKRFPSISEMRRTA